MKGKRNNEKLSVEDVLYDIETNHNTSWIKDVIRNKEVANDMFDDLEHGMKKNDFKQKYASYDSIQSFQYLVDNIITKAEFIYESFQLAKALKSVGLKKEGRFVICMDRTPEFAYLVGAASIVGATINLISEKFTSEHISKLLKKSSIDYVFIQDIKLQDNNSNGIKTLLNAFDENIEKIIVNVPFDRSVTKREAYEKYIEAYYSVKEPFVKREHMIVFDEFVLYGERYYGRVEEESNLNDVLTITYSSGTTAEPKGIMHSNRHYITMGRYHDSEISGMPAMQSLTYFSSVPTYSNSYISSCFSDCLYQNSKIALDPVENVDYFATQVRINKGNINTASVSSWIILALQYSSNPEQFKNYRLNDAIFNFAAGEPLSVGAEILINRFLKKVKSGRSVLRIIGKDWKLPFAMGYISTAGGLCECGSLYNVIFRQFIGKIQKRVNKSDPIGMNTLDFVDTLCLREDGTKCEPYEVGRLYISSPLNMVGYDGDPKATDDFYCYINHKRYADIQACGYLDEKNNLTIKGRVTEKLENQLDFRIEDAVNRDAHNVCMSKVICVGEGKYCIDILLQPKLNCSKDKFIQQIEERIFQECGNSFRYELYFRKANPKCFYPLTKSLKVDNKAIINQNAVRGKKIVLPNSI